MKFMKVITPFLILSTFPSFSKARAVVTNDGIVFTYTAPQGSRARAVYVAGSFDDFEKKYRLSSGKDGRFSLYMRLPLTNGEYRYRFQVDKTWTIDIENTNIFREANGAAYSKFTVSKTITHYDMSPRPVLRNARDFDAPLGEREYEFWLFEEKARRVFVVGDMNNWDISQGECKRNADGAWVARWKIRPGPIRYLFNVDGDTRLDPKNIATRKGKDGVTASYVVIP